MAYLAEAYNSLPSLAEAAKNFKEKEAEQYLFKDIRQLFLDHGVHTQYGVSLLHKHFSIEETERLVEFQSVATPWKAMNEHDGVFKKYNGYVVPRTYRFMGEKTVPYEFAFQSCGPIEDTKEFFVKFSELLDHLSLQDTFGLRLLAGRDPDMNMEVTEGKANIMMMHGAVPESELIEALWIFGVDEDDRCHCREYCWKVEKDHLKDHGCS